MAVTVGIKAFNEEAKIAASLESAVTAARALGGDVIFADSGSTDRTVEIAQRFPVRIVQLANPAERCCGAGAQLAYQEARGDYFYLLDGDMMLRPDFLPMGIAYLESHPETAGVGGHLLEKNTGGEELQVRTRGLKRDRNRLPGTVDRLEGGGLYRATALRAVGYFADRNLHGYEEFELAARLQCRGWTLARIDHVAAEHFGHTGNGFRLLWQRARSGYADGAGELLRSAIGTPRFPFIVCRLHHVRNCLAIYLWWVVLLVSMFLPRWLCLMELFALFVGFSLRSQSLKLGCYQLASWNVMAACLIRGFMRARVSPRKPIEYVDLSSLDGSAAASASGDSHQGRSRSRVSASIAHSPSPSAEDRLPKSLHFAESDVIIGVVRARSVHEVSYGHKWDWEA